MTEATSTALILLGIGALLATSALASRLSRRLGLPISLLFLALGMLAGSQGLGGIDFADYQLSFRLGTTALALILFDGGLNTSIDLLRRYWAPATALATVGVLLTAVLVAIVGRWVGLGWSEALLLGAVVSSTDAAAVFSALRGSGLQLKRRVGVTLELESGLNDPVAVILTVGVTSAIVRGTAPGWSVLLAVPIQLGVGAAAGIAFGYVGRFLLRRARLTVAGLYPVASAGIALLSFAVPTLMQGSGFLAVYLAGMIMGGAHLPYRAGLLRVHDAVAWFAQVGMFLLLGLLVFPIDLLDVALLGLVVGLALTFVARPLAVAACLLPFRYRLREQVFIALGGLRGAVPIILATIPVMSGVPGAFRLFNVVFFVVVLNALVPGSSLPWAVRRLRLQSAAPPAPHASLEITSTSSLRGEVLVFHVDQASAVYKTTMAEIPFPPDAAAMLILRGDELIAPRGQTTLEAGDHVYVLCRPEDRPLIGLLFGRTEAD